MVQVAERIGNPGFFLNGHMAMALPLFYLGQFLTAHDHLEKSISYYGKEREPALGFVYGWDAGVVIASYRTRTFWMLGYPEKAQKQAEATLRLAGELSTPFHSAFAAGSV